MQGPPDAAPQQQHQQQTPPAPPSIGPFDSSSCRTLYVGSLHPYVTEAQLQDLFGMPGSVAEVKVIKEATGMSSGYGFVKFVDHG